MGFEPLISSPVCNLLSNKLQLLVTIRYAILYINFEIDLYGQVSTSINPFPGVGDGVTYPKNGGHFQGRVKPSPAYRNTFLETSQLL